MPIHPSVRRIERHLRQPLLGQRLLRREPEFGTEEDFRAFVDAAHALGMRVILDWVANHSAWDNPLVEEHLSGTRVIGKASFINTLVGLDGHYRLRLLPARDPRV